MRESTVAIAHWAAAGISTNQLRELQQVAFRITDLPVPTSGSRRPALCSLIGTPTATAGLSTQRRETTTNSPPVETAVR